MKKTSTILCYLFILLAQFSTEVNGKDKASPIDSIKVRQYMDSAFGSELFSARRQLYLDSALFLAPQYAWLWQQKAMPLFKQKKYELGLPYLDSAVKYDPEEWLDYRAFMKCIFQKAYEASLIDFDASLLLKGNIATVQDHPYNFYKALCFLQLNKFEKASILLEGIIQEQGSHLGKDWIHPLNWFYLGVAYYEQGKYYIADSCFSSCLELNKNFADCKYYKALCKEKTQEWENALNLMLNAQEDLKNGYSMNEDNSFYEAYPYQILPFYMNGWIDYLKKKTKVNK